MIATCIEVNIIDIIYNCLIMSFSKSNNYVESFYFLYFGRYLLIKIHRIV